jgi:hypothetical protein
VLKKVVNVTISSMESKNSFATLFIIQCVSECPNSGQVWFLNFAVSVNWNLKTGQNVQFLNGSKH